MRNAKQEFLLHLDFVKSRFPNIEVKAMFVKYEAFGRTRETILGTDLQDPENFEDVLNLLNDITYDAGYGTQELHGTIWYTDGTWSERWEYDGSEGWVYRRCPEIPSHESLKSK